MAESVRLIISPKLNNLSATWNRAISQDPMGIKTQNTKHKTQNTKHRLPALKFIDKEFNNLVTLEVWHTHNWISIPGEGNTKLRFFMFCLYEYI